MILDNKTYNKPKSCGVRSQEPQHERTRRQKLNITDNKLRNVDGLFLTVSQYLGGRAAVKKSIQLPFEFQQKKRKTTLDSKCGV